MSIPIFLAVLFLLQFICFWVGRKASRNLETQDDYFLAGRGIRFFPLMMTLVATQVGGGLVLGSAEEAYKYGWYVLLYPLGACLGLIALAAGIGRILAQFNVSTVAQLFETVYGSSRLKKVASLLSIVSLFLILVAQVIASQKFMLSLGVSNPIWFILFWGIVIFYTVSGGLKAVVATDIIQATFFIGIFFLSIGYSLIFSPYSLSSVQFADFSLNQEKLLGWLLMPLFFMLIEQDMAQRCFAAKSGKVVSWASGVAAICIFCVCIIPIFYGVLGKAIGIEIIGGESILMTVIERATTPAITALVGCAILAAIISTADSLMNAISSNISQDFSLDLSKNKVISSKLWTCGIAVGAFVCSFAFNNVVDLLILSYELSVYCLLIPVLAALFIQRGEAKTAAFGMVGGAIGFVFFRIFPNDYIPKELGSLMFSGIFFAIGYVQAIGLSRVRNYIKIKT